MWEFSTDVERIKHIILKETVEAVLRGRKEYLFNEIPKKVSPGPKPQFRCCIYHERAVTQERIELLTTSSDSTQMVHVLEAACNQCPVRRFEVSSSCQGCIAKRCRENCRFGAISFVNGQSHIDYDVCVECGRCARACQYNAITDHKRPCVATCPVGAISVGPQQVAIIDESKCINCGRCIHGCPFGAIGEKSFILDVLELLMTHKQVNAVIAPSIAGQYPKAKLGQIKSAMKQIGFAGVYEVAMGADVTVQKEARELKKRIEQGQPMTTSCCSSFVQLIHKHFPEILPNVSDAPSPMVEVVHLLESLEPESYTVFIGPCVSKKIEVAEKLGIDKHFAITFDELDALLDAHQVNPETCENEEVSDASRLGRYFPWSGGVTKAVIEYLNPQEKIRVQVANGTEECFEQLKQVKNHKFTAEFLEGMACVNGCVGGPGCINDFRKVMREAKQFSETASKPAPVYSD